MSNKEGPLTVLTVALRLVFAPIVKQSSKWPPILAYGVPGIVTVLLIILFRSALPDNLFWLMLIIVLAPLVAYIFTDWDKRRVRDERSAISGNVLFKDGFPIKGAKVFVEGVDRSKETDETGWFQIEVNEQASWVIRASYMDQITQLTVTKSDAKRPVRLSLKRVSTRAQDDGPSTRENGGQASGIRLRISKQNAASELARFVLIGEDLIRRLEEAPPLSEDKLHDYSSEWHTWRRGSESYMRKMFSSDDPLKWLKELRPSHMEFKRPWQERAEYLKSDVRQEISYFRSLQSRLDNYAE